MSAWESNARILGASIAVGAVLLYWHPNWAFPWFFVAMGAGFGAQFWASWKYVMIVALVLFVLSYELAAEPLKWSSMGIGISAVWMSQKRRMRATG